MLALDKKKSRGPWWLFIRYKGKRWSKKVGSKPAAKESAEQIEARLTLGKLPWDEPDQSSPTLGEYFKDHQNAYLKTSVKESTAASYEGSFRLRVLPLFGNVPLDKIDRRQIKRFVAELVASKKLKKASIRIVLAEFWAVLNHAVEDGYIKINPASKLSKFYSQAESAGPVAPLTPEEVPLFLNSVAENAAYYFSLYVTMLHTGMRCGEVSALRWTDIDFTKKSISVRSNVSRGKVGTTKTAGSVRQIDMSDFLIETLLQWNDDQKTRYKDGMPEWVFTSTTGTRIDMKNVYHRVYLKCLARAQNCSCPRWEEKRQDCPRCGKKLGIARRRLHDLRHTFATILIMNGESMAYVKDQMGHKNITMTVNTYTHWIPGSNRKAMNGLPTTSVKPKTDNVITLKKAEAK